MITHQLKTNEIHSISFTFNKIDYSWQVFNSINKTFILTRPNRMVWKRYQYDTIDTLNAKLELDVNDYQGSIDRFYKLLLLN